MSALIPNNKGDTLMIDVRARDNSGARNGMRFLLRGVSALLAVLFITSCGKRHFYRRHAAHHSDRTTRPLHQLHHHDRRDRDDP